ncbi:TonB-dependent receptor [Kiritimatiellota bacterium B12222]|nr:TonB-dependent receptor [Kiritimatiellota bacterium B12222]
MQRLLCTVGAVLVVSTVSAQSLETHNLTPLAVQPESLPTLTLSHQLDLLTEQEKLDKSLTNVPGVSMRSVGGNFGEPVLRGLGWERVTTQYNGLNLYGACPSRMDPPINLFSAFSLESVSVELGLPSVTQGPLSTAGRILLDSSLELAEAGEHRYGGSLIGGAGSNGKNRNVAIKTGGASDRNAWQIDLGTSTSEDYVSGDGQKVPADAQTQEASALWKGKLSDDLILSLNTRWIYDTDVDYVSLPMDTRHSKNNLYTGALQWKPEGERLKELSLSAGAGTTEHLMDNRDKANSKIMQASTPSTADTYTLGLLSRSTLGNGELRAGIDGSSLERSALRTRTILATGMTFQDPVWPDVSQEQIGVYGEWEGQLSQTLSLRAGVRIDQIRSDADGADAIIVPGPGIGKITVADAWQSVGGSTTESVEQTDTPLSGNLIFTQSIHPDWLLHLGLGRTEAAPNLTQRYLSFGPVPGGYGIGTPSLKPETKYEIELRTEGKIGAHGAGLSLFAARINDYLLPSTVAMADVNADGQVDRIKGTVNQDAEMWGLEAALRLQLSPTLSLPLSLSWVRGETTEGQDLPEIPPLEIDAALNWRGEQNLHPYAEFGFTFNARQDHVDENFGENESPSFIVFHLRGGLEIRKGWIIEAGIDNLFNTEYYEYLSEEALMPAGDLTAGEEVPSPGRSFTLSTQYNW